MSWWCAFSCGAIATLVAVTIVSWIVDESHEMRNFDDTQVKLRSEER